MAGDRAMRKYPISDFTTLREGYSYTYLDRWWFVSENDEVYFYGSERSPYMSPQCSSQKTLLDKRFQREKATPPRDQTVFMEGLSEVRLLPVMVVPINLSDYV